MKIKTNLRLFWCLSLLSLWACQSGKIYNFELWKFLEKMGVPRDKREDTANSITEALGDIDPTAEAVIPALINALRDEDWHVVWNAAFALGKIGPAAETAVPELINVLRCEHILKRMAAARALGDIGQAAAMAVPGLIHALGDEYPDVRMAAARALGDIGTTAQPAISVLIPEFDSKNIIFGLQCSEN